MTVGRHGVINADEARRRAALIIARVKAGEEPLPASRSARPANGPTVAELAARYFEEHVAVRCKPKTAETARTAVNRYILPALGKLPSMAVRRTQVMALHHRLADRPAMANAVLATLSHMYTLAEEWGAISEGTNPCRSVVKYPARRRERFLTDAEFDRLGRGAGRGAGSRRGLAGGDRGDPPADADRVPQERDPGLALGGCRSRSRRSDACRCEDRPTHGLPVAGRREAAGRPAARARQSVGHSGSQGGHAHAHDR